MFGAGAIVAGGIVGASLVSQAGSLELFAVLVIGGLVAWRSKRGDFYKSVAEEKTAEAERLRVDNEKLRAQKDLTPIVDELKQVTAALQTHARMTEEVFDKVADMNGSLRAHGVAMQALADRLVLDEASRALLEEASRDRPRQPRQTTRRTP